MRLFVLVPFVAVAAGALGAEPNLSADLGDGVKLDLILVAKGQFQQGSSERDTGRWS